MASNSCFKVFLVVVNLLFLVMGVAILGVGIYLCTNANSIMHSDVMSGLDSLRSIRFVLIGIGAFITLVSLSGIFGTCKENRCMLIVYLVLLFLILLANIAAVAVSVKYNGNLKSNVIELMKKRMLSSYGGNATDSGNEAFTKIIDTIQTENKCCGWTGTHADNIFLSTPWYQQQKPTVGKKKNTYPDSCCPESVLADTEKKDKCVKADNGVTAVENGYIYEDDCTDTMSRISGFFMRAVLGTVIVAILLQIICITCAIVIVRKIGPVGRNV